MADGTGECRQWQCPGHESGALSAEQSYLLSRHRHNYRKPPRSTISAAAGTAAAASLAATVIAAGPGLFAALPGSKMATAGADWATNPATQIRWGPGYIQADFGSSC